MRININFFITISLLLISFTGFSQMEKRYDDWQHPVLKRLERHDPNLATFSRKDSGDYLIPLAILNKANGMLYYISTFGQVFDSMSLNPFLSKELVGKRADAFRLYTTLVIYTFLKELEGVRSQIRAGKLDVNKLFLKKTYLNYKELKNAISPFEQLTWLINLEKLVWKNHYLFNLDLNRRYDNEYIAKEQDFKYFDPCKIKVHGQQYMDSVEYTPCNRYIRLSGAVLKPDKRTIYLFDQQNRMFDSFLVKENKIKDITEDKEDVFALYQLWLEWQLEKLTKEWNKIIPQKPARFDESLLSEEKLRRLDTLSRAAWVVEQKMRYATIPDKDLVLVSIAEDSKTTPRKKWMKAEKRWSDLILETDPSAGITTTFRRGQKEYFLTDHRGNVVATVSDRKIQVDSNHDGKVDYYVADVITATDYAPFGAHLTGRTYRNKGQQLKYGYNGKENDNEVKGEGNQQDYGFRIYDPRLGRFLSVDPLTKSYPWYTPYQFAGNKPIWFIDLDGLEEADPRREWFKPKLENRSESNCQGCQQKSADLAVHQQQESFQKLKSEYEEWRQKPENLGKSIPGKYEKVANIAKNTSTLKEGGYFGSEEYKLAKANFETYGKFLPGISDVDDFVSFCNAVGEGNGDDAMIFAIGFVIPEVSGKMIKGPVHHIFTNKNFINGQKWSAKFEPLFKEAGYKLDDAINKISVPGHKGPHPDAYHEAVFKRLSESTQGLDGDAYKAAFDKTLEVLKKEVSTAGTELNKLITKQN